ncbi:MAG: toll/interleukin-1 receptor domain-containing protein [Methylococcaceae bacterium]|nr:toll/interleukin-1 receptor domain-containing protein [Methylococcaceae bacterium]
MSNSKAFVSYSWATEHETGIVETLGALCTQRGIYLIRDNQALQHGQLINQFMDELSKGDHVITVFSKPYFQSKWCMYELLKIYQRGEFEQRTHPVIADDCDLQNQSYRLEIVKFWNSQYETAKSALAGIDPAVVVEEQKRVNLYRDIYQNINELVNFAANRVTTPLVTLKQQDYAPLLDRIKISSQAINHLNEFSKENVRKLLPKRTDSEFLAEIKRSIAQQLEAPEVAGFKIVLKQELDTTLKGMGQPLTTNNRGESIAESLIVGLTLGGNPPPVINEAIMSAAINCLDKDKKGGSFQSNLGKHADIKFAIEQILGWLVLASVEESYAQNITDASDLFFELPVATLGGVEVIASRFFQRQAKLRQEGTKLIPNHVLDVSTHISLSAWTTKPIVDQLRILLWNQVFTDRTKVEGESVVGDDLEELNAELANRRSYKEEKYKEHHMMAFKMGTLPSEDLQLDVYRQLYKGLNNLTLIRFGSKDETVFCVPEYSLISAVRALLTHINNLPLL